MFREIAVIASGAMGSAVARRLADNGVRVPTLLDGRSAESRKRAEAAGMVGVEPGRIAEADLVLSIVPPAQAIPLARQLAPVLAQAVRKPIFVDCNAVNVATVIQVGEIIASAGARFADAGIIGSPPRPGEPGPTFYVCGGFSPELAGLREAGLRIRTIDGPVGRASALKMAYAGITKGLTGIAAAMILSASRAGVADLLHDELAASQAQLLARFGKSLPDMYAKAYRWVAEMQEIAAFAGDDPAAVHLYEALAEVYGAIAADHVGRGEAIAAIDDFLQETGQTGQDR